MPETRVNSDGLTPRQERFIVEYCVHFDGKRAAIAAGYSTKTAQVTASKLLTKPRIAAAIQKVGAKDCKKLELTREKVLGELAKSLFRDPIGMENADGFVVTSLKEIPRELRVIIDGFKVFQQMEYDEEARVSRPVSQKIEVKLVPKASTIDMAMKHLGAYAPVETKNDNHLRLDWDSLYGRSPIIDPVQPAIDQVLGNEELS